MSPSPEPDSARSLLSGKLASRAGPVLLLLLLLLGLRPRPLPVELAPVRTGSLEVSVLEEGKTRIRNRYVVSATVAGLLLRTPLRAGDPVVKGETLVATIEPEASELLNPRTRTQAEARVQSAAAALHAREAELERARAAADLATRDKARADSLSKSGAISEKERDAAEMGASMRARELKAAEFNRDIARYELAQAEALLHNGRAGSAPMELRSPVSGVVLNVLEENARPVFPGAQLLELGDPSELEAEIEVLSNDAAAILPGAPVRIERWGGPGPLPGRVRRVEPAAFTKTSALGVEEQRVRVLVDFSAPLPDTPKLGDRFRVEGRIQTWKGDHVLQVPAGALFRRGETWNCFVLERGEARLRSLEVGRQNPDNVQILSGLKEGETVVVHPPEAVRQGSRITERKR